MKGVKKKTSSPRQDPKVVQKGIGKRLRKLRKELGYSNGDDFAYDNPINRSQYGKYEAGNQDMRISTLVRVVNALGVTLEEFFREKLD